MAARRSAAAATLRSAGCLPVRKKPRASGVFSVRPAGRTPLEADVLCPPGRKTGSPGKGRGHPRAGSIVASRFRSSQWSRKSLRRLAMCVEAGMPTVMCTENIVVPVCGAG